MCTHIIIAQSTNDEGIKPKGTGYSNTDGRTESWKIGIDDTKTTAQQEKEAQLQADTELNESETSKKLRLVDDQQGVATGTDREKLSSTVSLYVITLIGLTGNIPLFYRRSKIHP